MKAQSTNLRAAEQLRATQPFYLYVVLYNGVRSYYAGYDKDVIIENGPAVWSEPQTFAASQISHKIGDESVEPSGMATSVSVPASDTELRKYFLTCPSRSLAIEIYRGNSALLPGPVDYTDLQNEMKGVGQSVGFAGYVLQAAFLPRPYQESSIVPQFKYQKLCNHRLGNRYCKVILANYATATTIAAISRVNRTVDIANTTISVDVPARVLTISSETFFGGKLVDVDGNIIGIVACEVITGGTRLWLNWWPGTLAVSGAITIYPGCMRIKRVCDETFQNLSNFGGTPYIPITNPATNSIIT